MTRLHNRQGAKNACLRPLTQTVVRSIIKGKP
jgi:hypothetical protein